MSMLDHELLVLAISDRVYIIAIASSAMMAFEGAEVSWTWTPAQPLPHAELWKPVSRENGARAQQHSGHLFLGFTSSEVIGKLKYRFVEEIQTNNFTLYKYIHVSGEHCALVRAVQHVELNLVEVMRDDANAHFEAKNDTGGTMWQDHYRCDRPLHVAGVKSEIHDAMLASNQITKQGRVTLMQGGQKLGGNKVLIKKTIAKVCAACVAQ